uniref:Ig-like domain-containing protein n=1 Tax=Chrysemys picta bellii TaxID=8478 RepID=A0A8C3F4K7_CHRPI
TFFGCGVSGKKSLFSETPSCLLESSPKLDNFPKLSLCNTSFLAERKFPPSFTRTLRDIHETIGLPVTFDCGITGSEPIEVTWAKNNQEIRTGRKYQISYVDNIAYLTVLNIDNADSGTYTCHASNEVGKDSCTAQLSIKGID